MSKPLVPEVLKGNPVMELMTTLFGGLPAEIPTIDPSAGLITRKFHKWKMQDLADIATNEASIAASQSAKANSQINLISTIMNIPLTLEVNRAALKHQKKMFKIEQNKGMLENQVRETEALRGASELKLMLQEIKKELKDGSSED